MIRTLLTVRAAFRHIRLVFLAEMKRLIAYRMQFWFEFIFSTIVELAVTTSVWTAVYRSSESDTIRGVGLNEMILYLFAAVFFMQAARGSSTGTFARDIYDGAFTKYLVYPLSVYSYKLGTYLPRTFFSLVGLAIGMIAFIALYDFPASIHFSIFTVLPSLFALLMATLLYFCLLFCVEAVAFWADHVWALSVMLQFSVMLLSGKWIPLNLFPDWYQRISDWLPFQYIVFFPVQIFLGKVALPEMVQGITVLAAWVCLAYYLSKLIYNRGLRQYTGVGM